MLNDLITWLLDAIQSLDPTLRTLFAGLGMLLETSAFVGLLVPGDAVVLLAATGVTSLWAGAVLVGVVVVGAVVGESLGYALGRWFGPALQASRVGRLIREDQWDRAQRYVQRRGGPAVFLSRFIPVLHSTVPMIAGMTRMRFRTFLSWTVPACLVWATAYVTVGSLAASVFRDLSRNLSIAGYLLVGAALLFAAGVYAVKRLVLRVERRHLDPAESEVAPRQTFRTQETRRTEAAAAARTRRIS